MKVRVLQMDVRFGEPEANYSRVEELIRANARGADVLILPEMWNAGYALEEIHRLGDREGRRAQALVSDLARKFRVNIIAGSVAAVYENGVFNEMQVFDREGQLVQRYRKIHRFRLMREHEFLAEGESRALFEVDGVPAGGMICYDLRFPELARSLVLEGAQVLFIPAQWPWPRLEHWRILNLARAIENQCFVVSANTVGPKGKDNFFGHSMVIDPWGQILVEGGESEEVLEAELDLSVVPEMRRRIPVLEDRRPNLYSAKLNS